MLFVVPDCAHPVASGRWPLVDLKGEPTQRSQMSAGLGPIPVRPESLDARNRMFSSVRLSAYYCFELIVRVFVRRRRCG